MGKSRSAKWQDGVLLALLLIVAASAPACSSGVADPVPIGSRSPSASTLGQPSDRAQLRGYVRKIDRYQHRADSWDKEAAKAIKRVEDIGGWSSSLEKDCWRLSDQAENLAVEETLLEPPTSLTKAHGQLVSSWRDLSLVFSLLAKKVSRPDAPDATNTDRVNRLIQRAQERAQNWRFAVRVQTRKLDVEVPWKW